MKKNIKRTAAVCGLCLTVLAGSIGASAAFVGGNTAMNQTNARPAFTRTETMFGGQMQHSGMTQTASEAGTVVEGTTTNSAAGLTADYANAATITMSESNSSVKIKEAGTYIVTGACADGSITVAKGTTGVVLILRDLDLTSTTGATLSVNKGAEAKIIVEGSVTLTDAEDAALEDVSEDFDGAAIKVKSGASAYLTGTGTLTVNGSTKNGVKVSASEEDGNGSLVIDGATVSISAVNDGINAEYDLAILSGKLTVSAGDDAIHADRVLTFGKGGNGPTVTVSKSTEGVEATVVNLFGGTVNVTAAEDGVNAANSDGTYASLGYSVNIDGGSLTISSRADGIDSNGNVNLISGSATISSASNGGDAGIDYDGSLYVSESFTLNNQSGVTSMGAMGGMMGGMGGQMGNMQQNRQMTQPTQNQPTQTQPAQTQPAQNGGQAPMQGMEQQPGRMPGGLGMNNRMGNPCMGNPMGGFGALMRR